jgi:hypothetical protein
VVVAPCDAVVGLEPFDVLAPVAAGLAAGAALGAAAGLAGAAFGLSAQSAG